MALILRMRTGISLTWCSPPTRLEFAHFAEAYYVLKSTVCVERERLVIQEAFFRWLDTALAVAIKSMETAAKRPVMATIIITRFPWTTGLRCATLRR